MAPLLGTLDHGHRTYNAIVVLCLIILLLGHIAHPMWYAQLGVDCSWGIVHNTKERALVETDRLRPSGYLRHISNFSSVDDDISCAVYSMLVSDEAL